MRSASAQASGKVSLETASNWVSQSLADCGALRPRIRMDARMRGSIPIAICVPSSSFSSRVRMPVGDVSAARVFALMKVELDAGTVSGAARATGTERDRLTFQATAVRAEPIVSPLACTLTAIA